MATALITGASNGIGLELAKVHASKGGNLVLVARNKAKLDELKAELERQYKITVYT
ncbi:MAG: SDR family NAD(P)-dependent oxidoreductase, partial [Bacteroidota bacterium]